MTIQIHLLLLFFLILNSCITNKNIINNSQFTDSIITYNRLNQDVYFVVYMKNNEGTSPYLIANYLFIQEFDEYNFLSDMTDTLENILIQDKYLYEPDDVSLFSKYKVDDSYFSKYNKQSLSETMFTYFEEDSTFYHEPKIDIDVESDEFKSAVTFLILNGVVVNTSPSSYYEIKHSPTSKYFNTVMDYGM